MTEFRTADDLERLEDLGPDDRFLVTAGELRRWAAQRAGCDEQLERERQECLKIVEHHLRLLVEERRLDPLLLMEAVAGRIRQRSSSHAAAAGR